MSNQISCIRQPRFPASHSQIETTTLKISSNGIKMPSRKNSLSLRTQIRCFRETSSCARAQKKNKLNYNKAHKTLPCERKKRRRNNLRKIETVCLALIRRRCAGRNVRRNFLISTTETHHSVRRWVERQNKNEECRSHASKTHTTRVIWWSQFSTKCEREREKKSNPP